MSATTMITTPLGVRARLLRRSLAANAAFSSLSGLVLAVDAAPIADFAGVDTFVVRLVGIGLLPFAAWVAFLARPEVPDTHQARAVIAADLAWVAVAAVVIAWPGLLSTGGRLALAAMTLVVADLAWSQRRGVERLG